MPAPLFQYVWQYNNQPIEQLAQDIVNVLAQSGNGPVNTADYIPVSNGLTFEDSLIYQTATNMKTMWTPAPGDTIWGMELDYTTKDVLLGDHSSGFHANTQTGNASVYAVDPTGPAGNAVVLDFNAPDQTLKTDFGLNGDNKGFKLDFANGTYAFGEYAGTGNLPQLIADVDNSTIGMSLDGNGLNIFKLGLDVDGIVLDANESVTSGGLSGTYIAVKVNGVNYKLALYSV